MTASTSVDTAIGPVGVEASEAGVRRVRLPGEGELERRGDGAAAESAAVAATQLAEFARGEREAFDVPLDLSDVEPAHRRVLETLCEIAPYGTTVTYGELGARAGIDDPREVGVMMATNPLPLVVPSSGVVTVLLHLGTSVACSDGALGELAELVIHPDTRRVTHLVVAPSPMADD